MVFLSFKSRDHAAFFCSIELKQLELMTAELQQHESPHELIPALPCPLRTPAGPKWNSMQRQEFKMLVSVFLGVSEFVFKVQPTEKCFRFHHDAVSPQTTCYHHFLIPGLCNVKNVAFFEFFSVI